MQRITVKSVVTKPTKKEGTNITTIEDEKGAKMSAFNDTGLEKVHAGDVLEVEVEIDGRYSNIKGWKLIESKPAPPQIQPPAQPPQREPFTSDPVKNASIEAQTAYNGIMNVWASGQVLKEDAKEAALQWALSKLNFKKAPEKPEDKESFQMEQSKPALPIVASQKPVIDLSWLSVTMKMVNWKDATLKSWLKMQFKVDTTGTIEEVLSRCDPNQINMLVNHLNTMAEASGVK